MRLPALGLLRFVRGRVTQNRLHQRPELLRRALFVECDGVHRVAVFDRQRVAQPVGTGPQSGLRVLRQVCARDEIPDLPLPPGAFLPLPAPLWRDPRHTPPPPPLRTRAILIGSLLRQPRSAYGRLATSAAGATSSRTRTGLPGTP